MKKNLTKLIALTLAIMLLLPCNVFAASTKAKAQKPVKDFYKFAKTLNWKKMNTCVNKKLDVDTSDKTFHELCKIIKPQNKKLLKISIKSTKLAKNKKSATMKVKVQYRSLYKASYYASFDMYSDLFDYAINNDDEDVPDEIIIESLVKNLKKRMKKYPAKKTSKTVTIKTQKYKNGWKIKSISDSVGNTYLCDIIKGMNKASKDFIDAFE